MSGEPDNLVLNLLRAIRAKLDEHDLQFEEVITRLGRLERESVNTRSEIVNLHGDFAGMHQRSTTSITGSIASNAASTWSTKAPARAD
jgi:hypothetical protein